MFFQPVLAFWIECAIFNSRLVDEWSKGLTQAGEFASNMARIGHDEQFAQAFFENAMLQSFRM